MTDETTFIQQLRNGDIKAFKSFVMTYSEEMILLAYILTGAVRKANDIVGDILLNVYGSQHSTSINQTLHKFLFDEVRAACLSIYE